MVEADSHLDLLPPSILDISPSLGKKSDASSDVLIFPALVLGYESINVSMYREPVSMYNDIFV
jgi:hypothetical protein